MNWNSRKENNMIKVTYEYPSAYGNPVRHSVECLTDERAEYICKLVEERTDKGYKLIDVTRE